VNPADGRIAGGDPRRILAMGGGGFTMGERSPALDRLVLSLTNRPVPKICFLPTASGDPREQVTRFHERFSDWPCEPSIVSLFNLGRDRIDPVAHLLAQDAIYVGGGSMRNMLAIWREHGIDEAMQAAWRQGVVLAGVSAGAMCWFEGGISMSAGAPEPVRGFGLLAGSLSVHLDGENERLPAYRAAIVAGELPAGYAADDGAALLYEGTRLAECVASHPGARVLNLRADGAGGVRETELPVRLLPGAARRDVDDADPDSVSELRALRAGRHRWD
jgi:dipeptidase E